MSVRRIAWKALGPIVGVLLIGLAVYHYYQIGRRECIRLKCSGRNDCAASSHLAHRIVTEVQKVGIELELVEAQNSHDICVAVEHRLLDVGVVLGGYRAGLFENVQQVASLGVEPLHLVVRSELVQYSEPTIEVLRNCRVYIGEAGTNSASMVKDLLSFAGLRARNSAGTGEFEAVYEAEREIAAQVCNLGQATPEERERLRADLPDALFVCATLPSPIVDGLVKSAGYRLVPLPYATALHLDERRDHGPVVEEVEDDHIEPAVIPAYTYGAAPPVPAQPCETIGLRLLLVAHKDVPKATIHRLLRALDDGTFDEYHAELNVAAPTVEFPLHAGAASYAASQRPVSFDSILESATNALSMVGAFCAGSFALWSYVRGLRTVSPQYYLQQIDRIERLVRGVELEDAAPTAPIELLVYLETRLAHLKQTVVEDYARGRLKGDEALMSILTLIADTRNLLVQTHKRLCQSNPSLARGAYLEAA
ncbi:MAG: hypothetical protein WD468_08920 [Pirellulales bacterium]